MQRWLPGAVERKELQSRLGEDAVHQARLGADVHAPAAGHHGMKSVGGPEAASVLQPAEQPVLEQAGWPLAIHALELGPRLPAARCGCVAETAEQLAPQLPELQLPAQVLEALPPACGDDEHRLQRQAPARGLVLRAPHLGGGGSLREQVLMHARVSPSPSARELAQSGRR